MNTEHQNNEGSFNPDDRLLTINQQLEETEQALRRTLEFFDRIEGTNLAARLGASEIRLRLLSDLEQLEKRREGRLT